MKLKIGIDSYCYHRFFGEVYPWQTKPCISMDTNSFLARAKELGVDGVSLESCFFPSFNKEFLNEVKAKLDDYGFDRVYAWGHPDGLERGQSEAAYKDMLENIPYAKQIGAEVMRVCGSSLKYRMEPHEPQIKALTAQFKEAMKTADEYGVKLAMENHHDYNADEMLQIIEGVANPNFGITFDTGNFLRVLDDPVTAIEKLAKYTLATHIKDVVYNPQARPDDWNFFASVPVGTGWVDTFKIAEILKQHNYKGLLAVEIDSPHPDWANHEDEAVSISVKALRELSERLG